MRKQAWQRERELRQEAIPFDRRINDSNWYTADFDVPYGDALIDMFWKSSVPGSSAPEIPYQEMMQAKANLGYDVSEAEALLDEGLALHQQGNVEDLRVVTARIMAALYDAPVDAGHSYHQYEHPNTWEQVLTSLAVKDEGKPPVWNEDFAEKIYQGWIGQLAGGSFGTAIEGYTGEQIAKVYGEIDGYITEPETTNDDVVYELVLLDVFEKYGRSMTSEQLGWEWVRQIPFGWSAEWMALRNLALGIKPPQSGDWHNPYSDWIGVQMRGMINGLLAPAWPMEAIQLAHIDGVVSHSRNGVYGGMFAAVLTSLAFVEHDIRDLIKRGMDYLPQKSEYMAVARDVLAIAESESDPAAAWKRMDKRIERYNWIHAYPNLAADLFAMWYGGGDFTKTMSLLAQAGNDVDCNAGLVGTVLGVLSGVPEKWAAPIGDLLETYIKGKEKLSIKELARRTAIMAKNTWPK